MLLLESPIKTYAWGSRTALGRLLGHATPSAEPQAELWVGAHPAGASQIVADGPRGTLLDRIEQEPLELLGVAAHATFGKRLPFLLKILAAAEPLSLQAHPSAEQARAGFAREEQAGIPRDAPERSYRDPHHKPELICALEPFVALCGFRAVADTLELLSALEVPGLESRLAALHGDQSAGGLRAFVGDLLAASTAERAAIVEQATARCRIPSSGTTRFQAEHHWATRLGDRYPGDIGVVIALCMNLIELTPGQAIFLPSGNLHAYLEGVGVEIMSSSDNVLRGGLTPKHVDIPELLRVVDFTPREPPRLGGERVGPELVYRTDAVEFELSRLDLEGPWSTQPRGPELLLCIAGRAVVQGERGTPLTLDSGRALFVGAREGPYTATGRATLFIARTGLRP